MDPRCPLGGPCASRPEKPLGNVCSASKAETEARTDPPLLRGRLGSRCPQDSSELHRKGRAEASGFPPQRKLRVEAKDLKKLIFELRNKK